MRDASRTVWYLSLQDEWQFARDWELTAGVRYDRYSDFGDTLNPRMALVWAARHDLTAKILYGRAFRAPSFIEQFSTNNPVALGNPGLDPETIDTFEVAVDYRPTFDLQTSLSVFTYHAKDLIEFIPDAGGATRTARNARDQDGYGFEFEVDWRLRETLRLRGHYAWQRSEDAETKQRIADAPGQKVYLSANWEFLPDWSICPQYRWIGSRKRAGNDPRSAVDDYSLVDLALRRDSILDHLNLALVVRNLFDKDAREPSNQVIPGDYPLEGRQFLAEISYRF
ncbi:TonB-dependent receptor plug domain-containing protein [Geoalkalibacter sp.]|uniref:TonB-dependent receptor plug domain-containing protein n=1 Tax=Geoalkalibacter sp. TaxID=3041440 RepID=UPI00272DDF98|nr:TonB-dependent receptor [Geoalkalibacter sp.]